MKRVGRYWRVVFSPCRKVSQIPVEKTQEFFREVFEIWGLPGRIQVDNGRPWGNNGHDLPSALVLWWWGLGIEVTWIPPRKPQRNGVVERSQGVLQQWAEPERWESFEEGVERLAWAVQMQREGFRGADGKTRMERYPALRSNPRTYRREQEEEHWSLEEVDRHLASWGALQRWVGKTGQITLYNRPYSVGRQHAGKAVWVKWDRDERVWVVRDREGTEIRKIVPQQFDAQAIRMLRVTYIKPSRKRKQKEAPSRHKEVAGFEA